jgi:NADP-dependent 3-hydroxy acid dehydrogenase YdfG
MEIQGRSCIVTGASSGIGAATARHLYGLGAKVTLAARRTERIEALAAELPGTRAVTTDVTNPAHVRRLVREAVTTFGGIDVLVNNAGQGLHVSLLELDPIDLRAVFELSVVAPLVATQSVLPAMVAAGGGAVVNVSSASTLQAAPGLGGYAAAKSALNMLSEVGRLELADKGVSLSVVYPSGTDTEFHRVLRAGHAPARGGAVDEDPPELVAQAIVFAIKTGEAHVLVDDPPLAIDPRRRGVERRSSRQARPGSPRADHVPEATTPAVSITWAEVAAGVHA